jgi:hypothetical protein
MDIFTLNAKRHFLYLHKMALFSVPDISVFFSFKLYLLRRDAV